MEPGKFRRKVWTSMQTMKLSLLLLLLPLLVLVGCSTSPHRSPQKAEIIPARWVDTSQSNERVSLVCNIDGSVVGRVVYYGGDADYFAESEVRDFKLLKTYDSMENAQHAVEVFVEQKGGCQ